MPKGCFVILLPLDSDYKVLGSYFKDESFDFEVTSDLFLRLNLDHSKSEYNLLKLKDNTLMSYLYQAQGKLARKINGFITGLILTENDDPDKFRTSLKNTAEAIANLNLTKISKEDFESKLKELYQDQLEILIESLDPEKIKNSVIARTKELLGGSKKDRKEAQELLELIEDDLHTKISENYKLAEKYAKEANYKDAGKYFEKAAEIAEQLHEETLAKELLDRSKGSNRIPELRKNLENAVQTARSKLKNEDFHMAYVWYKKAAEIAKELMLSSEEEEYSLKAKALQDFHQIDQKFQKK
ncbi:MAG: hypothetical protein EU544_03240 [Promethearchaeota archaeon]|nr:MAG: hypothetical protein EU544_03240 [Candidatus Lokiarchaeota archaeon]